jgi:hypothetical protein
MMRPPNFDAKPGLDRPVNSVALSPLKLLKPCVGPGLAR